MQLRPVVFRQIPRHQRIELRPLLSQHLRPYDTPSNESLGLGIGQKLFKLIVMLARQNPTSSIQVSLQPSAIARRSDTNPRITRQIHGFLKMIEVKGDEGTYRSSQQPVEILKDIGRSAELVPILFIRQRRTACPFLNKNPVKVLAHAVAIANGTPESTRVGNEVLDGAQVEPTSLRYVKKATIDANEVGLASDVDV